MNDAPSLIIRDLLVSLGLVTLPSANQAWPCFMAFTPANPASAVTLFDTQGIKQGRISRTGEVIQKEGLQIGVRSADYPSGYSKMSDIQAALDAVNHATVIVGANAYNVQNCSRPAPFVALGVEDETMRHFFSHNYILTIQEI